MGPVVFDLYFRKLLDNRHNCQYRDFHHFVDFHFQCYRSYCETINRSAFCSKSLPGRSAVIRATIVAQRILILVAPSLKMNHFRIIHFRISNCLVSPPPPPSRFNHFCQCCAAQFCAAQFLHKPILSRIEDIFRNSLLHRPTAIARTEFAWLIGAIVTASNLFTVIFPSEVKALAFLSSQDSFYFSLLIKQYILPASSLHWCPPPTSYKFNFCVFSNILWNSVIST